MRSLTLGALIFCSFPVFAQEDIAKLVTMDEFVVSAGLEDFDVEDFVDQVINDTTFYQAFLNLKYYPHKVNSEIQVFKTDESEKGKMYREAVQRRNLDNESWIEIQFEKTNGKIKKRNGEWKYLTAEMYDDVFFPEGKQKVSNEMTEREQELVGGSKLEKHKAQLKKMLFNPGQEIDNVPFIGDKLAIFDAEMVPYYDYAIFTYDWNDSIPTIAFSQYVKKGMEDDVVIRDMTSYFHKDTREVIAREYRLAYNTIFFDFDISIKVENQVVEGEIVPKRIDYDGAWDIPFKKPEIIKFYLDCYNYVIY